MVQNNSKTKKTYHVMFVISCLKRDEHRKKTRS